MADTAPLALVTGVSSGIGLAVARRLSNNGWRVEGVDVAEPPADVALHHFIRLNLGDAIAVAQALDSFAISAPTAFIHCAGIMRSDRDPATKADCGATLWMLHVGAAARIAHHIAPVMPDRKGRFVFVSSRAAEGRAERSLYAASKAALSGLARSLAIEHVARGITANVVAPAATNTPQLHDPARRDASVRPLPIGRVIEPDEVAATIAFFAGREAGAITGQTILQCGGASLAGV